MFILQWKEEFITKKFNIFKSENISDISTEYSHVSKVQHALFYNTEIIRFVTGKSHLSQQFYHISCLFASEKKKK